MNDVLKVSFTLQEIKQLVISNIKYAHDINDSDCLSRITQYDRWHIPLINYYKKNRTTKPTMADKLCFIILLSYPEHIVEGLNDISDIKLFMFRDECGDFNYITYNEFNNEEEEYEKHDCICSFERLKHIYIVENKFSGIRLQVGSKCIHRYNIISNEELKKFKETEKLLKIKQKEEKEGKPIGWYEEEKKRKKEEKQLKQEETQKRKEETQQRREMSLLNKELIKQEKIKSGYYKICYNCDENLVYTRHTNLCICNKCKNANYEILGLEIRNYGIIECENCNHNFIDVKRTYPYLCKTCKITNKILKCCMCRCQTLMIVDINTHTIYCDDCEIKIIKCVDCKKGFIQTSCESRCSYCQSNYNYNNKFVTKSCLSCYDEITVKKTETWITYCSVCYINIQSIIECPPKCSCMLVMCVKTIKKEGKNKGRKALSCSRFPNGCNEFKML
jgi:hypothetical protein